MTPHETITGAIRDSVAAGRPALVAFITAGFPESERFIEHLTAIGNEADVVEIGVPFSDPMADGLTIQRSSHIALAQGVSLRWILAELTRMQPKPRAPLLLMSYLNPLMAYGFDSLPAAARAAGVSGFIVPDLPFEESAELRAALEAEGLGLVQLVTPVTSSERLRTLCAASRGFVYAVTMLGTTGRSVAVAEDAIDYMERVRQVSPLPVCAGFGIRSREQVQALRGHVDGVIVGSALVEVLERDEDPATYLRGLR
jgi:tryptophan synthase alpha chain